MKKRFFPNVRNTFVIYNLKNNEGRRNMLRLYNHNHVSNEKKSNFGAFSDK